MTALTSGGLGMAAAATAHADPGPIGPRQWCPGQSLWITGNHVTNPPVIWDNNICHTYYIVDFGQGNVAQKHLGRPESAGSDPSPPAATAVGHHDPRAVRTDFGGDVLPEGLRTKLRPCSPRRAMR